MIKNSKKSVFLSGCLIGAIIFILIYGVKVLNVEYDSWLLSGGDLTQHYMGWKYFRNSQWSFPIGLIDGLIYPQKVSVIYMDSIPIFAIIFKCMSPILPKTFQYFGIWGVMSFMLQGGISAIIIRKFTKNYIICMISSIFFIIFPVIIQRMFIHTSLAANWIILLAIYTYIANIDEMKKNVVIWSIIACLSVSSHIYYLPMTMIILSCYLLRDYLENRNIKKVMIIFACPVFFALLTMYLLGAFVGKAKLGVFGLGSFSANLNSLFNPQGFSIFLKDLPIVTSDQGEGFAYLGLGIILIIIVAIYLQIGTMIQEKKFRIQDYIKNHITKSTLIICICIFFILAISPCITFNDRILLNIPYPKIIKGALGIFRASGRFMWPICYLIIIFAIKTIINRSTLKQAIIFLIICVAIQISDLSGAMFNKHNYYSNEIVYTPKIKLNIWDELSKQKYKHMVFLYDMESISPESNILWDLSNFAVSNNITVNDNYVARKNPEDINKLKSNYIDELKNGNVRDDTIYIFGEAKNQDILMSLDYPLNYYIDGGMIFGVKNDIPNAQDIKYEVKNTLKTGINILPKDNKFLNGGSDKGNDRILNSQGVSFGPYISLKKGNYNVLIKGNDVDKCIYDVVYNQGKNQLKANEVKKSKNEISFNVTLEENLDGLEFRIFNNWTNDISLSELTISSDNK